MISVNCVKPQTFLNFKARNSFKEFYSREIHLQIFLRLPPIHRPDYVENIWDVAPGALILEEAGGCVTDAGGRQLEFRYGQKLEANRGVVASAGPVLHKKLLAAVAAAVPAAAAPVVRPGSR
jgi:3'-phosphoadenosine 5'-phosphosulfate (PAPS) 3'-phosphatase